MKPSLRSIKLLLILVLFSCVGITPASSAKLSALPEPYDCYRSCEEITTRMAELTSLYPGLARVKTIGQSFEDRPIQVLLLGREVETNTKPRLVLVSGLQANTLAPVELNLSFAEFLLESYGKDANVNWLLDETEIHLIVVANPDGRLFAEQQALNGDMPTWTKNRNLSECTTGNGGVALSLNFSYGWSAVVAEPCDSNYAGPSAASEFETQAIQTYLEQILAQNPERSLVIDLQNDGDWMITPFLYDRTAENPFENSLFMLANKLAYDSESMPSRGMPGNLILTGTLTDFAFGDLHAPSLRFNLGPLMAGGDVTNCLYFDQVMKPEGLISLARAARLTAEPLAQAQGPEINFNIIENDLFAVRITGQADDASFYKIWLNQDEYSAIHHISFSLDAPPWQQDAVLTQVSWSQPLPDTPYIMDFAHLFHLAEIAPGKHTLYFQAWDSDIEGEPDQAGMINAIEISVPLFSFIPLLIR